MHPTRTRLALSLAGAAALVALTGCSAGSSGSSTPARTSADSAGSAGLEAESPAPAAQGIADEAGARSAQEPAAAQDEPGVAIIATGAVALEAEDVNAARRDVRRIVDLQQGRLTSQETSTDDEGEVEAARLVVRVPSARFQATKDAFEEVGTLTDSSSSEEDVSAQVVDVAARVRAQRASVERIEALLDRAQNLAEVVSIERQLADRQANLDALVARQRELADKTSLSTITVSIERAGEDGTTKNEDSAGGFLDGLRDGWDAFTGGVVVTVTVLGFVLPWLILVAVLGFPAWLLLRRRAARRPAAPGPATPATP